MSIIKLQSSDGEIFDVEIEIAKASNTIKNMIEGEGYSYELLGKLGLCIVCTRGLQLEYWLVLLYLT